MQPALALPYTPRRQQAAIHGLLARHRHVFCVTHRRLGKTTLGLVEAISRALAAPASHGQVTAAHIMPLRIQGAAVAWPELKRLLEPIAALCEFYESTLTAYLPGGNVVVVTGSDAIDALRGRSRLIFACLDEAAWINPELFPRIIRPMLADLKGGSLHISSAAPSLRERFEVAQLRYRDEPDGDQAAVCIPYDASTCGDAISPEEVAAARRDMSEEDFASEFGCSFVAGHSGSILGRFIERAYAQGRIGPRTPYDPARAVTFGCDIGTRDHFAVWGAQVHQDGPRLVYYAEGVGLTAEDACELIAQAAPAPETCRIALPHDAAARTFTVRHTTLETFARAFPGRCRVVRRTSIGDRINAARKLVDCARFHEAACASGLRRLAGWEFDIGEDGTRSATPKHDVSSHGADAFSYLAQALIEFEALPVEAATITASPTDDPTRTIRLPALDQREVPALPVVSLNGKQYLRGDFLESIDTVGRAGFFGRQGLRGRISR